MAKILLVEDDNNLREIYEARLQAEGYQIVSAADGEAALVVAKKEMPDLVISDVMMPRISGFEMLDILRNTEGLKNVKVIMLTALGQAEDKTRADNLGADKYLVKSQVTLEDIVKSAAELLGGEATVKASAASPVTSDAAASPAAAPTSVPTTLQPTTVAEPPTMPVAAAPPLPAAPAPAATTPPTAAPAPTPPAPVATPTIPPVPAPLAPATGAPPITTVPEPTAPAPSPAAVAPPAPPAPVAPTAADSTTSANTDDKLVADAVKDLINGTPGAAEVAAETKTPEAPPTAAVEPVATPVAPTAVPQPSAPPVITPEPPPQTPAPPSPAETPVEEDDNVTVAKKKIIQPLEPSAAPTSSPSDLNELMAKEGHGPMDPLQPNEAALPHQPGHVISPNPVSSTGEPIDPSKISL